MKTLSLVLWLACPAGAWEAAPERVPARLEELGHEPISKLERARQARRPGWVDRKAWSVDRYTFAVGRAKRIRNPALLVAAAEARARRALAAHSGLSEVSAAPVDWYLDRRGVLHVLVVESK